MATGSATWDGSTDTDWNVDTNWTPEQHPADGDTATFDGTTGAGLPDANLPAAGTIGFAFTGAHTLTIANLLNGAAIGAVTLNYASASITAGADITGAITITSGSLYISAARTLGSTVAMSGDLVLNASGVVTANGTITMSAGSLLENISGTTLDIAATKSLTGTGTIDNAGTIQGTVNMTAPTWTGTGVITVDEDGTLDLGTNTANSQSVDVAADVTIGDHFTCYGFDGSSGEITGAAKTITVGSGGLTNGGATLDAVGTLNVIVAETPAAFDWAVANSNHSLGTLTVNAATTMTDTVYTTKVAGSAAIAVDARLYVRAMAADFWTNTATHSGSNRFVMYAYTGSHANTALINIGTCEFQVVGFDGTTTTLNGGLTCGVLDLNATAQNLVVNGPLSASGNTTLDDATLTLGSAATHSFGGTITSGSTGILIIDGTTTIAGNVTTTGIAVTVKTGSSTTLSGTAVWDNDGATEFEAGVTLFSVYGFDGSSGVITGGGNTITVGAGGLDYGAATLDAAGTLNLTFAETTTTAAWTTATTSAIGTVTLTPDSGTITVTTSGNIRCRKLAGSADATLTGAHEMIINPPANDFYTFAGTHTTNLQIAVSSSRTNTDNDISIPAKTLTMFSGSDSSITLASLECGTLTIFGAANKYQEVQISGNLTGSPTITLGNAADATRSGRLTLSASGAHVLGAIARTGTNAVHELTFGGNVTLDDDVTFAGTTPDFGSATIYMDGGNINASDSGTVANTNSTIFGDGSTQISYLVAPTANHIYAYTNTGNKHRDARGYMSPKSAYNCSDVIGNTNVDFVRIVASSTHKSLCGVGF